MELSWGEVFGKAAYILNYKLFEIDGNGISLGKLLSGLLLLVLGYLISKRAAREVEKRVLIHMPIEESLRYTMQQLLFYFMLFLTSLFTLRALNVPITIFTVLGGALAVGIGFGSQNLVNNFISGLLVMMERPIRVGDFIEVEGTSGCVEHIGIRATAVRTLRNVLIVIPNTVFIEKNLTNWSMSGFFGTNVSIGVSYETDLTLFQEACRNAMRDVSQILSEPQPTIAFMDFGDSALLFQLTLFVAAADFPLRKTIESDLRFRLHTHLAQAGIEIPFPIRDVRLRPAVASPV